MDWFRSAPDYRRKIYLLLIIAILLTLPCYCIGLVLLIMAPEEAVPPSATPGGSELSGPAVSLWGSTPPSPVAGLPPAGDGPRATVRTTSTPRRGSWPGFASPLLTAP